MRSPQRIHPDDPFTPGRLMRFRVAAARVWWRWPRARPAVLTVLAAVTALTVIGFLAGPPSPRCTLIPVKGGLVTRSCR